jgi:hypothetical protein
MLLKVRRIALRHIIKTIRIISKQSKLNYELINKDIINLKERLKSIRLINKERSKLKKQLALKYKLTIRELKNLIKEINVTYSRTMDLNIKLKDYNVVEINYP